jgi:DNA-binding MarR family transcriptional regulator
MAAQCLTLLNRHQILRSRKRLRHLWWLKMSDADRLLISNQLGFALYVAAKGYRLQYRKQLASIGLTYPQYLVILTLFERQTATSTQLSKFLKLDASTLTPILRRLTAMGSIQRSGRPRDHRVVDYTLTAKALAMRDVLEAIEVQVESGSGIVDFAVHALRDALHALDRSRAAKLKDLLLQRRMRLHPAERTACLPHDQIRYHPNNR